MLGIGEMVALLFIAYLVLGPERLPDVSRRAGRIVAEFRSVLVGLADDVASAMASEGSSDAPEGAAPPEAVPALSPRAAESEAQASLEEGHDTDR
jgi:sec-independent protein translocase protein TatB